MNPHIPHFPPLAMHLLAIAAIPVWLVVMIALWGTWLVQGPTEWFCRKEMQ